MKLLGSIFGLLLMGCIGEPEYDIVLPDPYNLDVLPNSNLEKVVNAFEQDGSEIFTFDPQNDMLVSAYVISSDSGGNFFKTLIVQDMPENPSRGLEVKIDQRSYYLKYNLGRKILLKLAGLSIQKIEGKYVLGYLQDGTLTHIPESLMNQYILRTEEIQAIVPTKIKLEEIRPEMINTFVCVQDIQFVSEELGNSFSSESHDKFQGERRIEQCDNRSKSYLFTSTYARFKANLIPEEKFSCSSVLSLDTYSKKLHFVLNDTDDLKTIEGERCDPDIFFCDDLDTSELEHNKVLFFEDFDQLAYSRDIEKIGWENLNKNFRSGKFKKRSEDENVFLQVSAYGTNEAVMECWLISPEVQLVEEERRQLYFDIRTTFEEGKLLTLWFSQDYTNSIDKASWYQLKLEIPSGSADGDKKEFSRIGPIDLSCIQGNIRLAFKYIGGDPGDSTTYDIDNILILGESM